MYKYIYGPIPSRRLGISLGVDVIPYKICSLDCVYCECGKTTLLTDEIKNYINSEEIIKELEDFLDKNPYPDYITISGSGEPLLNCFCVKEIIEYVKDKYKDIKIAIITNGTLLYNKTVRECITGADLFLPSLDAAINKSFKLIDRPYNSLDINNIIEGIKVFRDEVKSISSKKEIWLEIFFVENINTDDENINKLREAIVYINPDKVQLNSLDRPGTEDWVKPLSRERMEEIKTKLNLDNVEIISRFKSRNEIKFYKMENEERILEILARRPCTVKDLSEITAIHINELNKYLDILEREKKIVVVVDFDKYRGVFYKINK